MKIEIVVEHNRDPEVDDWEWVAYRKGARVGAGGDTKEKAVRVVQAQELRVVTDRLLLGSLAAVDVIEFVIVES